MSSAAKAVTGQPTDPDLCPKCGQPWNNTESNVGAASTDPPLKQNEVSLQPPGRAPKKTRRLLRSDTVPTTQFTSPWRPNLPVWVRVYDKKGNRGWMEGKVYKVLGKEYGEPKIVVHIQNDNGDWVIPRTVNVGNQDPIPHVNPSIPNYKISDYIVGRDECEKGLTDLEVKHWRCIKYNSRGNVDAMDIDEQDAIGKSILNNPHSTISMRHMLQSLMVNNDVTRIVKIATGQDTCSAQYALAYFIGQLCGIELSESANNIDPKGLLDQIGSNDKVDCPLSQVFLMSAMVARTKKGEFNPSTELFDCRGCYVLNDPKKLKARMGRLKTALAAIHSSQGDRPLVSGPSFALLAHGIHLMIDMRGTSDRQLNKMAEEGICRPASVIRRYIHELADAIDPLCPRIPPTPGDSHVLGWTADNADFHLFHRVVSVVPVGNVLLGKESEDDTRYFNQNYMKGLGKLSKIEAEQLLPTKLEDDWAKELMDRQNILALLTASADADWLSSCSQSRKSNSSTKPSVEAKVTFSYRSEKREGTVKECSTKSAKIEFHDGGRLVTRSIPITDIDECQAGATPAASAEATSSAGEDQSDRSFEMFEGERHHFDPTTTSIASILTGLSSKNNETARQVIQAIINKYGEERFSQAVHIIVADQEFMPTIINEFFSRLGGDEELPIIPALAIGHALKGLSVSMMAYYKCFFDPMLAAMGIKEGSPEYARLYKGSVIRDTNNLVTNFTETLAVAAAYKYLSQVGKEQRIKISETEHTSPIAVINAYFDTMDGNSPDPSACLATVMDPNMRPMALHITDSLKTVARDFHDWARLEWGTTKRSEVGPSGYEADPSTAESQQQDQRQQDLSKEIEEDIEHYQTYRDMSYGDNGDSQGLLTRCINERLLLSSSRKDKQTLSKKLYLFEVRKDKQAAINFGPARKVPDGTNSTALTLFDLIFGVERFVLVLGHLLTKIRPKDDEKKENESFPRDWLVFFKSLTVSTFMRWQPNYQRLTMNFLIQLKMILTHNDPRCTDLALKRIRWTMSVSEWGDSHKCYPMDLLQEHSMVQLVKNVGRRDPTAFRNLEARVLLRGFIRMQEVESRVNSTTDFHPLSPDRLARVEEQIRMFHSMVVVWLTMLDAISPIPADSDTYEDDIVRIQGLGNDETRVLFTDRSRAYFRITDALDHCLATASAFIKACGLGYDVATPQRLPYSILRSLHLVRKVKKSSVQTILDSTSQQSRINAEQSLTRENHLMVPSSHSLLDGILKAGENKSEIYPLILRSMSHNQPYKSKEGQIGGTPRRPVILTRTKADATKHVMECAKVLQVQL